VLVAALVTAMGGALAWPVVRPDPGGGTALVGARQDQRTAPEEGPATAAGPSSPGPQPVVAPAPAAPAPPVEPRPAPPAPPAPPPVLPERDPGRVFVAGDSLTFTAVHPYGMGDGAPADVEVSSGFGWTVADVQPAVDAAVLARPIDTLVVAMGTNDAAPVLGGDGWTGDDVDRMRRLVGTVPDSACVVLVLPGYGPGIRPEHAAAIDAARLSIQAVGAERAAGDWYGPTVVVDWQEVLDEHPGTAAPDGIHMVGPIDGLSDPTAAALRRDLMWGGVDACG
jgi:hypothetical protein